MVLGIFDARDFWAEVVLGRGIFWARYFGGERFGGRDSFDHLCLFHSGLIVLLL